MAKLKKEYSCSLMLTHDLIGGKWKLRILWHIMVGDTRFSSLQREMKDITSKVLSSQLRELESAGLISRKVYPDVPPRVEYDFTDLGRELYPVLKTLSQWSNHYAADHGIEVPAII